MALDEGCINRNEDVIMKKPFSRTSSDGTTRIDCYRIPNCNKCPFREDDCEFYTLMLKARGIDIEK